MLRIRGFRFALAVGASASLFGFVGEAVACSPPPSGWFSYYGSIDVPQNGVVPVKYTCYVLCEPAPDPETFVLRDQVGSPVPGSVSLAGGAGASRHLVFKPDAELALGTYTAELPGVRFETASWQAVGALSFSALTPVASFNPIDRSAGDEVCCSGPIDSCGGRPCFYTELERSAGLMVDFRTGDLVEDGQYAHRFVPENDSGDPIWTYSDAVGGYELEEQESSTCYTLEVLRLTDGVVQRFEERCVDVPETLLQGVHPTPPENISSVLRGCDAAPDDFEEEWCEAHAERCSAPAAMFCEEYTATCSGTGGTGSGGDTGSGGSAGDDPTGGRSPTGGTSPTGGRGGSGGTGGDAGASGEDGAGEDGETTIHTEGCGCTLPGRTVPVGSVAAIVALALGSLSMRRRARKIQNRA